MFKYTVRTFVHVYSWETIPIETVILSPAGDGTSPSLLLIPPMTTDLLAVTVD